MESRIVPLNALIALCSDRGMLYPTTFLDSGYQLSGIEVPASGNGESVVIDAVMFQPERNMVLAGEAKSGSNVDETQALRYKRLEVDTVISAASITVKRPGERQIQPVYCCPSDSATRVLKGLNVAGLSCPVLAFDDVSIENHGSAFLDTVLQDAFQEPLETSGPPPRIVLVDEHSPIELFEKPVMGSLVAALSRNQTHIGIPALAEQSLRYFVLYGKGARHKLIKKVDAAARAMCASVSDTFEYRRQTREREFAIVHFLRSPEWVGRQGRTQAYQAIERAFHAGSGRTPRRAPHPNQATIFDTLFDEREEVDPTDEEGDQ